MSVSGVAVAIGILRDAYPRADFPDGTIELYATMLAPYDDDRVVAAVRRLVTRERFLPAISEILREVIEASLALPTAPEAYQMLGDRTQIGDLPTVVLATLKELGGRWEYDHTENPGIWRAQFLKAYDVRREAAIRAQLDAPYAQLGPTMASLPVSESIEPRRSGREEPPAT